MTSIAPQFESPQDPGQPVSPEYSQDELHRFRTLGLSIMNAAISGETFGIGRRTDTSNPNETAVVFTGGLPEQPAEMTFTHVKDTNTVHVKEMTTIVGESRFSTAKTVYEATAAPTTFETTGYETKWGLEANYTVEDTDVCKPIAPLTIQQWNEGRLAAFFQNESDTQTPTTEVAQKAGRLHGMLKKLPVFGRMIS